MKSVVAILGGVVAVAMVLFFAQGLSWATFGFAVWVMLPCIWTAYLVRKNGGVLGRGLISWLVVMLCLLGDVLYFYAFFVNPDPQAGLAFVVVPLYQLAGVGILTGGFWVTQKIRIKTTKN